MWSIVTISTAYLLVPLCSRIGPHVRSAHRHPGTRSEESRSATSKKRGVPDRRGDRLRRRGRTRPVELLGGGVGRRTGRPARQHLHRQPGQPHRQLQPVRQRRRQWCERGHPRRTLRAAVLLQHHQGRAAQAVARHRVHGEQGQPDLLDHAAGRRHLAGRSAVQRVRRGVHLQPDQGESVTQPLRPQDRERDGDRPDPRHGHPLQTGRAQRGAPARPHLHRPGTPVEEHQGSGDGHQRPPGGHGSVLDSAGSRPSRSPSSRTRSTTTRASRRCPGCASSPPPATTRPSTP